MTTCVLFPSGNGVKEGICPNCHDRRLLKRELQQVIRSEYRNLEFTIINKGHYWKAFHKERVKMKNKLLKLLVLVCVFGVTGLACGFVDNVKGIIGSRLSGGTDFLGEEYRSEKGGFSLQKIAGYDFDDFEGIVSMKAPDGDPDIGPVVIVMGHFADHEFSNEEMFAQIEIDSSALHVSDPKKIVVDGKNGLISDLSGKYKDQPIFGSLVIIMVTATQQLNMISMAPEERWKEVQPIFDAVLKSIKIFEPILELTNAPTFTALTAEPTPQELTSGEGLFRQWARSAIASSEFGDTSWAAYQATGKPDVDSCSDSGLAWASSSTDTLEWIELSYDVAVTPTEINIYQSYNPSQVIEVQVTDTEGIQYSVWTGNVETVETCPDLLTLPIGLNIKINKVMIIIDQSILGVGWNEIDAVELVGYR
ncbi:MAG: hypothetical protein NTZ74_03045 [Chloroflexi bacterium]|nr:hypothetical protein [Chloroflexota bacterium]